MEIDDTSGQIRFFVVLQHIFKFRANICMYKISLYKRLRDTLLCTVKMKSSCYNPCTFFSAPPACGIALYLRLNLRQNTEIQRGGIDCCCKVICTCRRIILISHFLIAHRAGKIFNILGQNGWVSFLGRKTTQKSSPAYSARKE